MSRISESASRVQLRHHDLQDVVITSVLVICAPLNGSAFQVRREERAAHLNKGYHLVGIDAHGIRTHHRTKAVAR
jgi:hypothetical protein